MSTEETGRGFGEQEQAQGGVWLKKEEPERVGVSLLTWKRKMRNMAHSRRPNFVSVGAYGEILAEGQTFRHRMVLDVALDAAPGLEVGGMVRQSDEGELAFAAGPDRLASERGSVALRYRGRRFNATMGYYSLHLTPLLLMRWDLEDNPEGGGQSACACPGAGGAITAESLEKVGPDLTLEGVRFEALLFAPCLWRFACRLPGTLGERIYSCQNEASYPNDNSNRLTEWVKVFLLRALIPRSIQ